MLCWHTCPQRQRALAVAVAVAVAAGVPAADAQRHLSNQGSVRGDCKIRKEALHPRRRRPMKSMASSVATSSPNRAVTKGKTRHKTRDGEENFRSRSDQCAVPRAQNSHFAPRPLAKPEGRGRDEDCSSPPAQIPACAANAPGSSLGFWRRNGDRVMGVVRGSAGRSG